MHLYMVNFEFGESELQDGRVKFKFTELNQKSSKELFFLFYNSIIMV